jgi:tripeptidyl-peptidase-1
LTKAEVDELVKPSAESLEAVQQWLSDHEIDNVEFSSSRDTIKFALPLSDVEELLDTEYSIYEHTDGTRLVRTTAYSLPVHLHEHITIITPTNQFLRSDPRGKKYRTGGNPVPFDLPAEPTVNSVDAVCNFSLVTPTCLRTIYGTINYTAQAPGKNKVALNDFLGELNLRSDVSAFLEMFRPDAVAGASEFQQISIAGGTVQQTPLNETELENETGVEGDLDAETILGISYPTPLTIYSTGGLNPTFKPDLQTPTDSDEPYVSMIPCIVPNCHAAILAS